MPKVLRAPSPMSSELLQWRDSECVPSASAVALIDLIRFCRVSATRDYPCNSARHTQCYVKSDCKRQTSCQLRLLPLTTPLTAYTKVIISPSRRPTASRSCRVPILSMQCRAATAQITLMACRVQRYPHPATPQGKGEAHSLLAPVACTWFSERLRAVLICGFGLESHLLT